MENPEHMKRPNIKFSELHKIESSHNRFGYAPTRTVEAGETIEVPRDFVGTNYVNPGETPNVEYVVTRDNPEGIFFATRRISPTEELLTIPYGKGGYYSGPSYVGALGAATYGITPYAVPQRNPRKQIMETEKWHKTHAPKPVEVLPKKEDLSDAVEDLENQVAFGEARRANIDEITARRGLREKISRDRAIRLEREAYSRKYPEFESFERFEQLHSRGRRRNTKTSPFEDLLLWEKIEKKRIRPQQTVKQELSRDFQQIQTREKQSSEGYFSGPTTTLYRTLGGKRITKAEVPTNYLQELDRRTNPQKAKAGQQTQVQRRPRPNLIFDLPRIGNLGLLYPVRPRAVRPLSKKSRKR